MLRASSLIANLPAAPVRFFAALGVLLMMMMMTAPALGRQVPVDQNADLLDRPVAAVQLEGLSRVSRQEVFNNVRTAVGDPFDPQTVKADVARLNRLGQFKYVDALAQLQADGSVVVIYKFVEQAIINEVQVVGNRLISDADLLAVVQLVPRGPRDDFLIQNAKRAIEALYRKRGHYLTTVMIDESELQKAGLLIFRVNEGPRVKVKAIEFQGNQEFTYDQLHAEIKTRTAFPLLRKGELDEEQLAADVAALTRYYGDRGYIDVRVDRQIDISPDSTEAKVTFLIAEGARYTLRSVQAATVEGRPLKVFAPEQIAAIMVLKTGDVYSRDLLNKSIKAIQDSYGLMGYLLSEADRQFYRTQDWNVLVRPTVLRVPDQPQVDLRFEINEGRQYRVGEVLVQGNFLTRDKVVRRDVRDLTPGRLFDATAIEKSTDRLQRTRLFNEVRITVQPETEAAGDQVVEAASQPDAAAADAASPAPYRDILVEVKERNTGSINFGVAFGTDTGAFGDISLNQNNFDVTDLPESFTELVTGRAFRGAGQKFNATLRPGTELFQYIMSLTDPHLLDSDYSGTIAAQFRQRFYDTYDEQRIGGSGRISRQFGDVWNIGVQSRVEQIELSNIDADAPTELFRDAGPDLLTTLGVGLTRTTIANVPRPGRGSRFEVSYDRYGALGGDINTNMASTEYTVYFTVDEDFLGRISTLKLNTRAGHIFGGRAPTYERFYLGGRSFRGFDFRSISPKGIRNDNGQPSDDPVGGDWLFFLGAQYEFPIFADALTGVLFVDSGTVTDDPGFDQYRVSIGAGIRLHIPQFGDVPIAFDFGFPILEEPGDDEQLFSFSAELPF